MVGDTVGQQNHIQWPNGARAAICLTLDNMGEAADLNRRLWPETEPIGKHYSVTDVMPKILDLLRKFDISATYFIESWNINVYGDFILNEIAAADHEIGWHGWQHEAWSKLKGEEEERANFKTSFGLPGIGQWTIDNKTQAYRGFRPPGGIINSHTTLKLSREYGLQYLSPAAEHLAMVDVGSDGDKIAIIPFRWSTVDAYYYMETFEGLRKIKGECPSTPHTPAVLVQRFMAEIEDAIRNDSFRAILFHPFLTNTPDRLQALEKVLEYLAQQRDSGQIWLARCEEIQDVLRRDPGCVGSDPQWDFSVWR